LKNSLFHSPPPLSSPLKGEEITKMSKYYPQGGGDK